MNVKNGVNKFLPCVLFLLIMLFAASINASALSWDGSSTGGGGGGSPANANGYAVRMTGDNCIGYRFSVVDKAGNNKVAKVIDVFRNTTYGNQEYSSGYKFTVKYNKKQIINNQNNSFSTSSNTANCYRESAMGFASTLPSPGGMNAWQSDYNNLNRILSSLSAGSISSLKSGDKVIVEPLYDVRLQGFYHSVTTTELAIYGKWLLGASSNGGSSGNANSWGFISDYTNKHYPNSLYTPDGQGLWSSASSLSSRATFYNIINKGYGIGIAYTETKPDFTPNLSVKVCEVWKGSKSNRSFHYGSSNGSSFGNYSYANGYPVKGDTVWFAVNFPAESQNVYVHQSVRLSGGSWTTRNIYSSSGTWFDVALSPTTVDASRTSYVVEAKTDWIDSSGNVLKYGAVKTFYIPIRPKINRYQVTMYDITGTQVARNGSAGFSGSVYAGQRVYPKYTYTSENSWTSNNNFRAYLYAWKNEAWNKSYSANSGADLYINKQGINQSTSFSRYSDIGLYTVPDNSANTNGSNRIPFLLESQWAADASHTTESTWLDIPIIKADVELKEIRLIDENGYYISSSQLYTHQKITPQYIYKNNTGCTVYVEGYNSDSTRISGIYAIPAYGEIYVNGKELTVPSQSSLTIWGGVYLDGAGIYNTQYESNQSNNTKMVTYSVKHPLTIEPIPPNSLYRENTQVIASFKVFNSSQVNFIPDMNISVRFKAYKNGSLIYSAIKSSIVIPAGGDNLVYFKWRVPAGLNSARLTLTGDVIDNGTVVYSKSIEQGAEKLGASQTPNTNYEKAKPPGWTSSSAPSSYANTAKWSEWVYQNGSFIKKAYGIGLSMSSPVITPFHSPSAEYISGIWNIKSGYGFSLYYDPSCISVNGTNYPSSAACTSVQRAYATFPEFSYSTATGKYRTLSLLSGIFRFAVNTVAGGERVHYIPLWYPNGIRNYSVSCTAFDCWTPAGMIFAQSVSNPFSISGSLYDDHYIGRQ